MTELEEIRDELRRFAAARDWDQFHAPMNLAAALSVEASELLELFQWSSPEQSRSVGAELRSRAAEEIADVLLYLIRLADKLDIDLIDAARGKLRLNAAKYPVESSRGSSKKYTQI